MSTEAVRVPRALITEAKRLNLQPGDALLVQVQGGVTEGMADSIKAAFAQVVPGVRVLVHDEHIDVSVVRPSSLREKAA